MKSEKKEGWKELEGLGLIPRHVWGQNRNNGSNENAVGTKGTAGGNRNCKNVSRPAKSHKKTTAHESFVSQL